VLAEDTLFATLDPTTRRLKLPGGREVLLTDTVGFIQKLPTDLVAAFRATLEEVTFADVMLQVVDAAADAAQEQARTVDEILAELGAAEKPRVVALNKVDRLGPVTLRRAMRAFSERYATLVPISALRGSGLDALGDAIDAATADRYVALEVLIPYGREGVLQELRQYGGLERVEYRERGTYVRGRAPRELAHRFQAYTTD
jgi:GTP-binding protein HflX